MLPVLLEDGSSLDWRAGKYSSNVQIRHGGAVVENDLEGAPQLSALVEEGSATWALEVRCPRSLYAKTFTSREAVFEVTWDSNDPSGSPLPNGRHGDGIANGVREFGTARDLGASDYIGASRYLAC